MSCTSSSFSCVVKHDFTASVEGSEFQRLEDVLARYIKSNGVYLVVCKKNSIGKKYAEHDLRICTSSEVSALITQMMTPVMPTFGFMYMNPQRIIMTEFWISEVPPSYDLGCAYTPQKGYVIISHTNEPFWLNSYEELTRLPQSYEGAQLFCWSRNHGWMESKFYYTTYH